MRTILCMLPMLVLTSIMSSARAQDLPFSDPGLDAAIREALQKPNGPFTEQDLLSLTNLDASNRNISNVDGLDAARNLILLDLSGNNLSSLTLPAGLTNLNSLFLVKNSLTNFVLPPSLIHLVQIDLTDNELTNFIFPASLTNLSVLVLDGNQLSNFILPPGITNLSVLALGGNQLTNFTLPPDLSTLTSLSLGGNQLSSFILPVGLTNLSVLDLEGNQLTNLTLPPDQTKLTTLSLDGTLDGNPLSTLVLSEPLAETNLAATVALLRSEGVLVVTYSLAVQLISPTPTPDGAFEFALIGPPGVYTVFSSADLVVWSELGALTNQLGVARFTDRALLSPQKFYRACSTP